MSKILILTSIFFIFLTSCSNNPEKLFRDRKLPELQNTNDLNNTEFVPFMEAEFNTSKNIIYSAALKLAWQQIIDEIGPVSETEYPFLEMFSNSDCHSGALHEDDYQTDIEISDGISAKAYFNINLPFKRPLRKGVAVLEFKGKKVYNFGFLGEEPQAVISYYHNNDDFAIILLPEDRNHRIYLVKSNTGGQSSFYDIWEEMNKDSEKFHNKRTVANAWRYVFRDEDMVCIPMVKFHLENNYDTLEGKTFQTETGPHGTNHIYQRTAFTLNHRGAEIKDEGVVECDSVGVETEIPVPKILMFDDSFTIFLKRVDADIPYFAAHIADTELLGK